MSKLMVIQEKNGQLRIEPNEKRERIEELSRVYGSPLDSKVLKGFESLEEAMKYKDAIRWVDELWEDVFGLKQ